MVVVPVMIAIGQEITIGWNGAKYLSRHLVAEVVTVEAAGHDWIVVRDHNGQAFATGFIIPPSSRSMLKILES